MPIKLIVAGAVLFALSDSLIGVRQFRGAFPLDDVAVMATYIGAQLLIVIGCLMAVGRSKETAEHTETTSL